MYQTENTVLQVQFPGIVGLAALTKIKIKRLVAEHRRIWLDYTEYTVYHDYEDWDFCKSFVEQIIKQIIVEEITCCLPHAGHIYLYLEFGLFDL